MEYETCPESRLWGAFLLSIVRDVVPTYITTNKGEFTISRMSDVEFRNITSTAIFRLACYACDLAPSYVIGRMDDLRLRNPSEEFVMHHNKQNPKGGYTPIVKVHQYYIEDFYK